MNYQELRGSIHDHGGLVSQSELSRRWGVSRQRILQLTAMPDFPEPIAHLGPSRIWLGNDCDQWREARKHSGQGGDEPNNAQASD